VSYLTAARGPHPLRRSERHRTRLRPGLPHSRWEDALRGEGLRDRGRSREVESDCAVVPRQRRPSRGCELLVNCLECGEGERDGKSLSNHIKREHGLSGEDYTIKHVHGGTRPVCVSCGGKTRYSAFSFKRFCPSCARVAMKEAGARGGRAPAWNRGLTSETDDRIKVISARMMGSGNPFFGHRHDDVTRAQISVSKRLGGGTIEERIRLRSSELELVTPRSMITSAGNDSISSSGA